MLYSIAEAAKAMGLEQAIILKAIEDGQITGNQKASGEWLVEETELQSLYLSIAQDYCKRQWQADLRTPTQTGSVICCRLEAVDIECRPLRADGLSKRAKKL